MVECLPVLALARNNHVYSCGGITVLKAEPYPCAGRQILRSEGAPLPRENSGRLV